MREAFPGCAGATDVAVVANSASEPTSGAKAFVACSATHQVMVVWLAASPDSWRGKQDASLQHDHLLCMLDVGKTPTHLAVKPDGGEVFTTNFGSDSISEISTWTNEVLGTYPIGSKPANAVISEDNSSLWVTNFGADSAAMYSIDDGRVEASVHTGVHPDTLAFSADEHLLLIADSGSADVAVIRMQSKQRAHALHHAALRRPCERHRGEVLPREALARHDSAGSFLLIAFDVGCASLAQRLARRGNVRPGQQQQAAEKRPHDQPDRHLERPIHRAKIEVRQR